VTAVSNTNPLYFGYNGSEEPPVVKIPFPVFCFGVQKKTTKSGEGTAKGWSVCFSIPKTDEGKQLKKFIMDVYEAAGNHLGSVGKDIGKPSLKPSKESWENIFASPIYPPKDATGNDKIYTNLICFEIDNKPSSKGGDKVNKTDGKTEKRYDCQTTLKMITKLTPDGKVADSKPIDPLSKEAMGNYKMMPAIQLRGIFVGKDARLQLDLSNGIIFPRSNSNNQDMLNDEVNSYIAAVGKDKIATIGTVSKDEAAAAGSPDDNGDEDGADDKL